jgi:hypothetical protein
MDFFSIFLLIAGAYVLYAAILLKVKHRITPGVMLSPAAEAASVKDTDGFTAYMFPRVLGLALVTLLFGGMGYLLPSMMKEIWFEILLIGIYVLYIIFYIRSIHTAEKRFCAGKRS